MSPHSIKRVLIIDAPGEDSGTLRAGLAFADRVGAEVMVMVATPIPTNLRPLLPQLGLSGDEVWSRLKQSKANDMNTKLTELFPGREIPVLVAVGKPYMEIVHAVKAHGIDLVVKIAEELEESSDHVFASTDQHLLRKCPCKVWLRQPRGEIEHRHVLAALDVDFDDAEEPETLRELNASILRTALAFAQGTDAKVHVLHAFEPPSLALLEALFPEKKLGRGDRFAELTAERLQALEALGAQVAAGTDEVAPPISYHVLQGDPRKVIAHAVDDLAIAYLVMGTVARTGLEGVIIGNTAEDTQNSVARSLVAVKPAGFVSPLK
ncbi:MAG: universal stress protein [Pseudomonadota bacterium]